MNTINEQFTNATRQYADTAAQVNQLALQNFENVFGLQLSTLETNTRATFAFWNELVEARDPDAMRNLWPKGVQVARENVERAIGASQEAMARTVQANEAIGQIAKGQLDSATAQAQATVQTAARQAGKSTRA